MKQAIIVINDIKNDLRAIEKTKSKHLKKDRQKHIKALRNDLKEYCIYKGFNYKSICEEHNI